jgi:hypothetical protein
MAIGKDCHLLMKIRHFQITGNGKLGGKSSFLQQRVDLNPRLWCVGVGVLLAPQHSAQRHLAYWSYLQHSAQGSLTEGEG